jgi:hypothetical protein
MTATLDQPREALARANAIRMERAQIKRDVFAGRLTVPDAFDQPAVQTMPVGDLLAAQNRWGERRVHRLLDQVPCTPQRRVGELTDRQRDRIRELLGC